MRAVLIAIALVAGLMSPANAASLPAPRLESPRSADVVVQPEFQWSAVSGAASYNVQIAFDHRFASVWRTISTVANRHIPTDALPAGSYWWRVRAYTANGAHSAYSTPKAFTRRWTVGEGNSAAAQEVARPDQVGVEDFDPAVAGIQVPANAVKIWWKPVADASHYEVQFDGDKVCTTPHTVLTPNASSNAVGGGTGGGEACAFDTTKTGEHWVRVRAVDVTAADQPLYSLWSDQARSTEEQPPPPALFSVTTPWVGSGDPSPAVQTNPADDRVSVDAPVLEWNPVGSASGYRVVIARDRDFTNVVGDWRTPNTRLIPTDSLWDHTAMRSYYWMVLPCYELADGQRCLNESAAVNRKGKFRSFRKQSLEVTPQRTTRDNTPWTTFRWKSLNHSRGMSSSSTKSVPGLKWYEIQYRPRGAKTWSAGSTSSTDVTSWLSASLPFGTRLQWRVRAVDGTGESHAWSEVFTTNTPVAVPRAPARVRAQRHGKRLTLRWSPAIAPYFPVTGYTVWYSATGRRWKRIGDAGGTMLQLKLGSQKKFFLRVSAHNAAGEGRPSVQVRVR